MGDQPGCCVRRHADEVSTNRGSLLLEDLGDVQDQVSRPIRSRTMFSMKDHFGDESPKWPAFMLRYWAMQDLQSDPRMDRWLREDGQRLLFFEGRPERQESRITASLSCLLQAIGPARVHAQPESGRHARKCGIPTPSRRHHGSTSQMRFESSCRTMDMDEPGSKIVQYGEPTFRCEIPRHR